MVLMEALEPKRARSQVIAPRDEEAWAILVKGLVKDPISGVAVLVSST